MNVEQVIWHPAEFPTNLKQLADAATRVGGRRALTEVNVGDLHLAHVHGERHDLWWEFTLEASFKWQAHLNRVRPDRYHRQLRRLTRALGLEGLLQREVAALTHESRALADLAVALLPEPDLLLWEEPFYLMGQGAARRAAGLVRDLYQEGMGVVAIARALPGLQDLGSAPVPLHLAR